MSVSCGITTENLRRDESLLFLSFFIFFFNGYRTIIHPRRLFAVADNRADTSLITSEAGERLPLAEALSFSPYLFIFFFIKESRATRVIASYIVKKALCTKEIRKEKVKIKKKETNKQMLQSNR